MNWELTNYCEFDKYASKAYCAIHGVDESKNLGDITKVDETKLEPFNMIVGGSPCFVAGSKVYTECGYKNIEDINVGDNVLTLNNRFKPVVRVGGKELQDIYELTAQGILPIKATSNHPFYIRTMKRVWNNDKRSYERKFSDIKKVKLEDLSTKDYIGINILNTSENRYDLDKNDCWLLGRYAADGYIKNSIRSGRKNSYNHMVTFCIGKEKLEEFKRINKHSKYHIGYTEERTAYKCRIINQNFMELCLQCGKGAINKVIPNFIMDLPVELLISFLDGYMSGDGCYSQDIYKATTISKKLAMTLTLAIQKVYRTGCRIYFTKRKAKTVIKGRVVNQNNTYSINFTTDIRKQKNYEVIDDIVWYPIRKIEKKEFKADVYNLEVSDDHTYTVNNVIVSNCQDFSVAGEQKGSIWTCVDCEHEYNPLTVHYTKRRYCPICGSRNIEKTRSSLLVEWLRIIEYNKPSFGIYENVKALTEKKFINTFQLFVTELQEYGYNTYWQVLNAKNYGVPQNRNRVYLILIKKKLDNGLFQFPEPFDNGLRLRDFLEKSVDEKYYISQDKVDKLLANIKDRDALLLDLSNAGRDSGKHGAREYKNYSPCITARIYKDPYLIKEDNEINVIGRIMPDSNKIHQNQEVYNINGISGTIKATVYKEPIKVMQVANIANHNSGRWKNPQAGRVYSASGCSPTLNTCGGGGHEPKIIECIDKSNNQPQKRDIANCITSRKDRGISNRKAEGTAVIECVGNVNPSGKGMNGQVFSENGLSPTLTTNKGEGNKIIEVCKLNSSQDGVVVSPDGISKTLTAGNCPKVAIATLIPDRINKRQNGRRFKTDGEPSFTITAQDRHGVIIIDDTQGFDGIRIYKDTTPTLRGQRHGLKVIVRENIKNPHIVKNSWNTEAIVYYYIRIRKLTPKECFRLMGFSDEDFDKAKWYTEKEVTRLNLRSKKKYRDLPLGEKIERTSNSQLYKQAGNSIVVDVLYYILLELYNAMPYLFEDIKLGSFFSGIGSFESALDKLQEAVNKN